MSVDAQAARGEVERLEALGAERPDAPGVAAVAEAHRRAGEAQQALELAEQGLAAQPELVAARVARALALLDLERPGEARLELERILGSVPDHPIAQAAWADEAEPLPALAEAELDVAFAMAEPETDEMLSADRFAEVAIAAAERDEASEGSDEGLTPFEPEADPLYATDTVAGLLEEQGHAVEAAEIRRGLTPAPEPDAERGRVLPTLERWLDTLRRRTR